MTLLVIVWGILASTGRKLRYWVVPTFSVLVIAANIWTLRQDAADAVNTRGAGYFYSVVVTMPPGMRATLSIPINGANPESLVLYNERGEPQLSMHNPVTDAIDARIQSGGTYALREHGLSFADIEAASPLAQQAILRLASMDIMQGITQESGDYFRPDSTITRAELAAAVVLAFNLLDTDAPNRFTDISPYYWYYHAVATADNLNLVHGFEDGTFRGGWAITKEYFVHTMAEALMVYMGYHVPADIESILARFHDRDQLNLWSVSAIALATSADILIYREDGLFAPNSVIAREDAAIMLYRFLNRLW